MNYKKYINTVETKRYGQVRIVAEKNFRKKGGG